MRLPKRSQVELQAACYGESCWQSALLHDSKGKDTSDVEAVLELSVRSECRADLDKLVASPEFSRACCRLFELCSR